MLSCRLVCRRMVLLILLISVYFSRGTRRTSAMKQSCVRCLFQTASLLDGLVFSLCCVLLYMLLYVRLRCCFLPKLCVGEFSRINFRTSMLTGTLPFNFQNGASFDDVGTNFSRSWWIFALKMFHNTHNIPSQKQHAVEQRRYDVMFQMEDCTESFSYFPTL